MAFELSWERYITLLTNYELNEDLPKLSDKITALWLALAGQYYDNGSSLQGRSSYLLMEAHSVETLSSEFSLLENSGAETTSELTTLTE